MLSNGIIKSARIAAMAARPKPLSDLRHWSINASKKININAKRRSVSIQIVDDKLFAQQQRLQEAGFNISYIGNTNEIGRLQTANVVLSDLGGVAPTLSEDGEGAFFIQQLRATYPDKYIVAYSGLPINNTLVVASLKHADEFVRRTSAIDKWIALLDRYVELSISPYERWLRVRLALIAQEMDAHNLFLLEQSLIASVAAGDLSSFQAATDSLSGSLGRSLAKDVVSAAIWELLKKVTVGA